ncbi:hypothetical protein [Paenibacillus sp. OSY-SE]|nr:hypothetical protein [Paenibacillus sp. OSY-SE]
MFERGRLGLLYSQGLSTRVIARELGRAGYTQAC